MPIVRDFFIELDRRWEWPTDPIIPLRIIGSGALMLQTDYERGTKDGDVLATIELTRETTDRMRLLGGPGTALAISHHVYIDIVLNGVPFLAHAPRWNKLAELNRELRHFEISALDVVDVVVSKLKPFRPNDVSDIAAMIDRDLVPHGALLDRFRAAVDCFAYDARADQLRTYCANLQTVERDLLDVAETEIELPSWI